MDSKYEMYYHQLEEANWWFVARRHMILKIISDLNIKKDSRILEIGCSGGALMQELTALGFQTIFGIDISEKAIALSKKREIKNTSVMDGINPVFDNEAFDLIIASDVLEHMEDENTALQNWYRLLKPGGQIIVFVPAFKSLWSNHDVVNHHYRRYTKQYLNQRLTENRFAIDKISYWNFLLFFPVFILRKLLKFESAKGNLTNPSRLTNKALIQYMKIENSLIHSLSAPIGVSCYAVCSKGARK